VVEALTGQPPTQDEINRIAKPQAVIEPNNRFDNSETVEAPTRFESKDTSRAARGDSQAQARVGEDASSQTNIGRDAARNSRSDVTQGTELTGDGNTSAFGLRLQGGPRTSSISVIAGPVTYPEESINGLQLMCLMYAGFKRIAPEQDTGMDLNEPWLSALGLFNAKS
jgi:hypothetical protein